jgi:uncharacterized membrane protein
MSDIPVQVVIAAFEQERAADDVLAQLKGAKWAGLIGIQNAAVLRRDKKDKLHIKELKDWGGGKGAAFGGTLGAIVGVLTGPGILVAGAAGALIGGLAAKLRDSGFSDERLKTVGASLKPGTSAIIAVIEHKWVAELEKEMAEAGADVLTEAIASDIAGQLEAGREVAYNVLSTAEGEAISRVSTGEDYVEASGLAISEEGLIAGNIVATEDAIAGEQLVATDEGISYTVGAAVLEGEEPAAGALDVAEDDETAEKAEAE